MDTELDEMARILEEIEEEESTNKATNKPKQTTNKTKASNKPKTPVKGKEKDIKSQGTVTAKGDYEKVTKLEVKPTEKKLPAKGKGNPKAYLNSPFVGNNAIKATDEDMEVYWHNALTIYQWPKINLDSDDEVENRCSQYFEHCRNALERPTIEGLAVAIGVSPRTLNDWEDGKTRAGMGSRRSPIIKKAKALIQYMLAQMAVGNKIYPNVWIFYGKNWFGMKDQQDITITPNNQLQPNLTREQIIEKVKADVVIDVDDD